LNLFTELKRRNVFKVGAAYLVVGWLVIQAADLLAPQLNLPEWAPRLVTFLVLIGFPLALVLAWIFDLTAEGLQREQGHVGNKRFYAITGLLTVLALGWFFAGQRAENRAPMREAGARRRRRSVHRRAGRTAAVFHFSAGRSARRARRGRASVRRRAALRQHEP
jgi:hypothetical protein